MEIYFIFIYSIYVCKKKWKEYRIVNHISSLVDIVSGRYGKYYSKYCTWWILMVHIGYYQILVDFSVYWQT